VAIFGAAASASAQSRKPNIVVIFSDDVGVWNISAYHRGMMGGSTPNIDRIAREGALFTDYYAQQSCAAGRAAFIMGQSPSALASCGQFVQSFKEFPPSQKSGSMNLDQVMDMLSSGPPGAADDRCPLKASGPSTAVTDGARLAGKLANGSKIHHSTQSHRSVPFHRNSRGKLW